MLFAWAAGLLAAVGCGATSKSQPSSSYEGGNTQPSENLLNVMLVHLLLLLICPVEPHIAKKTVNAILSTPQPLQKTASAWPKM
jgi:hypothetical protein